MCPFFLDHITLKGLTQLMIQMQSHAHFDNVMLLDQKVDTKSNVKNAIQFSVAFQYSKGHTLKIPETISRNVNSKEFSKIQMVKH